MATLNTLAEDIAYTLGEQFNHTLKESIKNNIVEYRALYIRQDLERNFLSYSDYLQSFCIELEEVDASACPGVTTGDFVLRSKEPIPLPLRQKTNGMSNYKFVGSIDRTKALTFATAQSFEFLKHLAFQSNTVYYTFSNGYLIVLNNLKYCKLLIEGIIGDPRTINDCDFPDVLADDIALKLPLDMISSIKTAILRSYNVLKDGKEVNIEKDDKE